MKSNRVLARTLLTIVTVAVASTAVADEIAVASADGTQQVPTVITAGKALLDADINDNLTEIEYEVKYSRLRGTVTQAHLHLAPEGVSGGVMLFVCTNLGNGPAGTPACPMGDGEVSGVWTVDNVIAIPAQGLDDNGQALRRAVKAMRDGTAYLNIHTDQFPAGEIRGQVRTLSSE